MKNRYFKHTAPTATHTHCFYENQLINANSFRHISTKLLFHLIAGEFSITKLSLADFSFCIIYIFSLALIVRLVCDIICCLCVLNFFI